jgi:virulence factor Mce-like protein
MRRALRRHRDIRRTHALIGTIVVALILVAVYISWESVNGLPFQSRYHVFVEVPDAEHLVTTDEVRVGGIRVGQVSQVTAMPAGRARPYAKVKLSLDPSVGRLPVDTAVQVGLSAALGATYVNLTIGHSRRTVPEGGRLPLSDARTSVDLVDLLDIFDRSTATSIQSSLSGLGAGLAGRGPALNGFLAGLSGWLPALTRVSATLAAPATRLAGFLQGYESFAGALSPVARPFADLLATASSTFEGFERADPELAATIEDLPPAESAATTGFTRLQGPLSGLATLVTDLRPGGALLAHTLRATNLTLADAVRPLDGVPAFATELRTTLATLQRVSREPSTDGTVRKLTDVVTASGGLLQVLTPAQVDCDVIGLYGTQFPKAFTMGGGSAQSLTVFGFVNSGAQGSILQSAKPSPNLGVNYLPNENAHECESGNEPAPPASGPPQLLNPAGDQSRSFPATSPPAGVTQLAAKAGLLNAPPGTPR